MDKIEKLVKEKTCLHRFFGDCKYCFRDYSDKHPNNTDCCNYYEINVLKRFQLNLEDDSD